MSGIPVANSQESVFSEIVEGHHTIEKPVWVNDMTSYNKMPEPYKEVELEKITRKGH